MRKPPMVKSRPTTTSCDTKYMTDTRIEVPNIGYKKSGDKYSFQNIGISWIKKELNSDAEYSNLFSANKRKAFLEINKLISLMMERRRMLLKYMQI